MALSPGQRLITDSEKRFKVAICGRRWGKTYLSIRELAKHARWPNKKLFYVAPSYRMAKQIVWDKLKYKLLDMNWVEKINESDLSIQLVNGSKIFLRGADNYDSLRGVGLDFLVMDEFAMIDPKAWTEVLRPTLSDTGGHALFISTPMGQSNWAYELYQNKHKDPDNWESWQFTSLSGGRIPAEEIEQARSDLDEKSFRQEYEASFESYAGRIYYSFDRDLNVVDGAVTEEDLRTIFVGGDFNISPMSSVIAIRRGDTLCVIDEIRMYSSNTQEMCEELKSRYPRSKIFFYPDPAGHQRKTSAGGATDISILQNAGFVVKAPRSHTPVRDRINAVNSRLCDSKGQRHLFVMPKCKYTIEGLLRHTYKENTSIPDNNNDWNHMMDALGYMTDYLFPLRKNIDPDLLIPQRFGHRIA
jgi:phage terminase large subunit